MDLSFQVFKHFDYNILINLWLVSGHFSPIFSPVSAMGYLEHKLLRFQGLIWCINYFRVLLGCRDIVKNVKFPFSVKLQICKKNRQNANVKIAMDGDSKKSLKTAIIEFYKLNSSKGKPYTVKHFKNGDVGRATIYRWLDKFEKTGNCNRKKILSKKCLKNWNRKSITQMKMV